MNTKFTPFSFLFIFLLLIACGGEKTEHEQYEDATSGIRYNTYKTASRVTLKTSVEAYNLANADSNKIQEPYLHLLLGYGWTISGKPTLAFAEADIVEEDKDAKLVYLAQSLRSITMYQAGWPGIAKEEAIKAKEKVAKTPNTNVTYEAAVFYLLMGTVFVKEKDFEQAKFFWAGFATETDIHWPYQLCDAAADLNAGRIQQGLQKVKVISQDPAVPPILRAALAAEISKIEIHAGGDVDSSMFWPKLIAGLIWEELKNSSDATLRKIANMARDLQQSLPN
ncbi:hypothetical protein [Pseudochryseolinea flava]|uniref:Uncharacterized protein n=1 Tax=Pseudochryseolinea flava TaxID=2059302 RepID=A0A364Y151_9BACT|nr:hypothetical protein [Pseudochryseolinea flava]RAW00429.1 hypothetical protein DQQ10_15385 [Pseudochryseolinea flava]